jgi:hypothetical protein
MSRGITSINVILFLTILIAALILSVWYIQSVRPTRYVIGAVTEDMQELRQHLANACGVTIYNATYNPSSIGFFEMNASHFCVHTEIFGSCKPLPCSQVIPTRLDIVDTTLLRIENNSSAISLSLSS